MSFFDVSSYANWNPSFGVVFVASTVGLFLWTKSREMQRAAIIYRCATDLTEDFYKVADEIMSDPATPESIHDMIYDLTTYITYDEVGKKVYGHLVEAFHSGKRPKAGSIHKELIELGKHRLDLYEKIGSAISTWMFAMAAAHDHSEIKVTRSMVSSDRSTLFDITEKLLSWFKNDGPDGKSGGGRPLHVGNC